MARNEIRLMEAAVALAEELNFSRAAQRLRITQPALTKQIAELESRFALSLFERDSQAVSLTEAGRAFVEHARLALLHSERAVQSARAILANAETIVRVGKSPYGDPFLTSTLLALRMPLFPRLKVEVSSGFSTNLVHDLLSGKIDLALLNNPPESPSISMLKVSEEPFYVAISDENPLAERVQLTFDELDNSPWVLFARQVHPSIYDSFIRVAADRDCGPRELHEVLVPAEACPIVLEHNGAALLTKSGALQIARDGITIRPLSETRLQLKTYLASRADDESKLTSEMARAFGRKLRALRGDAQLNLPMSA